MVVSKLDVTWLDRFRWITNTLFHQALGVLTIFILWIICYNYQLTESFTWHMILCTIAYIPLMAEGIILFASENVWSQYISRTTKYWLHGAFLLLSALVVSAGNYCIIRLESGEHFRSIHGWTAFVSWIFVLLSQILGLIACKPQVFKSFLRPVWLKFFHNFFGLIAYSFGIVSLCYGINYGTFVSSTEAKYTTFVVMGIVVAWSIQQAIVSGYNQIKDIIR